MGCICSRSSSEPEDSNQKKSEKDLNKSSVQLVAPSPSKGEDLLLEIQLSRQASKVKGGSVHKTKANGGSHHHRAKDDEAENKSVKAGKANNDNASTGGKQPEVFRLASLSKAAETELVMAGWPSWLASVAGEAIKGWVPRRADSFEKLDKVSSRYNISFYFNSLESDDSNAYMYLLNSN